MSINQSVTYIHIYTSHIISYVICDLWYMIYDALSMVDGMALCAVTYSGQGASKRVIALHRSVTTGCSKRGHTI